MLLAWLDDCDNYSERAPRVSIDSVATVMVRTHGYRGDSRFPDVRREGSRELRSWEAEASVCVHERMQCLPESFRLSQLEGSLDGVYYGTISVLNSQSLSKSDMLNACMPGIPMCGVLYYSAVLWSSPLWDVQYSPALCSGNCNRSGQSLVINSFAGRYSIPRQSCDHLLLWDTGYASTTLWSPQSSCIMYSVLDNVVIIGWDTELSCYLLGVGWDRWNFSDLGGVCGKFGTSDQIKLFCFVSSS